MTSVSEGQLNGICNQAIALGDKAIIEALTPFGTTPGGGAIHPTVKFVETLGLDPYNHKLYNGPFANRGSFASKAAGSWEPMIVR